jgi:tryptophanase
VIKHSPEFIQYLVENLDAKGIPVITPAGGLGAHLDAAGFLPHLNAFDYPAGALCAALFIASGARGMERGTISMDRDEHGNDIPSEVELLRLAFPRRVFTLSQVKYVEDRITWLWENRDLIGGLRFVEETKVLRFFLGRLEATSDWPEKLVAKFKQDFGDSL